MAGLGAGTGGRQPSSREASQAMLDREERAAYNDAVVAASGGSGSGMRLGKPQDRAKYEGTMAVKRRRKMRGANITPEDEKGMLLAMSQAGGGDKYGKGFQEYRSRAALDDLAMRRTRKGGDMEAQIDPSKWSLPEHFRL